jgi:hypothetical protein
MSDTTYKLWCIAEGDNTPFRVIVASLTIYIDHLKKKDQRREEQSSLTGRRQRPHALEGALFLVICSDITSDTTLA